MQAPDFIRRPWNAPLSR